LTKPKTQIIVFSKEPSRPESFANPNLISGVSPGLYDDGKDFLSGAKGFTIGEKRPEKPNDNVGPGHYSPERAESITKPLAPSAKINANSPSRPESFANKGQIGSLGPGEYASNAKFGDDAKSFKFGEKRPEKPNDNVGPGHYSPEKAES